jgi:asparagine synthase (glutamine-hydrolysing)
MNNHIYTFYDGKMIKNKIWYPPKELSFIKEVETIDKLDYHIKNSIKQKTKEVDKIGLFLSGGIDSMSLVPLLQNETETKIFSYTASFTNNQDYDETSIAHQFAMEKNINHEICTISSNEYIENLVDVIIAKDGPSCINSEVAIYIILKLLKEKGIIVAMGGDNADSIFAPAHNDIEIEHDFIRIQRLKSFLPVKLVGPFLEATKKIFNKGHRLKDILTNDIVDYYFWGYFAIQDKYNLYRQSFKSLLYNNDITRVKLRKYFSDINTQDFKRLLFAFHHDHYSVTNIMRVENPSISQSVSYLLPYVDNNLLEIARSVPYSYINHPVIGNKYLLLKWAERYLPKETIYRKNKYAFNVPFNYWLQYEPEFYSSIKGALKKKNSFISTIMNMKELDIFIDQCKYQGNQHEAIKLWRIYNIEKWHEIYFN